MDALHSTNMSFLFFLIQVIGSFKWKKSAKGFLELT